MQKHEGGAHDPVLREIFAAADTPLADKGFSEKTVQAAARAARQSRRRRIAGWSGVLLLFLWLAIVLGGPIQKVAARLMDTLMQPLVPVHDPLLVMLLGPLNHLSGVMLITGAAIWYLYRRARPRRRRLL